MHKYIIHTEYPIASDSPDYASQQLPDLKMSFSAAEDNSTDATFIDEVTKYLSNNGIRHLDLGCGGGQLVVDMSKHHMCSDSFGIDGVAGTLSRYNWLTHPELFGQADLSKPFSIVDADTHNIAQFDLITCWEVIEHFKEDDLPTFFKNAMLHLADDGIMLCSIAMFSDIRDENGYHQNHPFFSTSGKLYQLHQTVQSREWWYDFFDKHGIYCYDYPLRDQSYRCGYIAPRDHPVDNSGAGGSLYIMLKKTI